MITEMTRGLEMPKPMRSRPMLSRLERPRTGRSRQEGLGIMRPRPSDGKVERNNGRGISWYRDVVVKIANTINQYC